MIFLLSLLISLHSYAAIDRVLAPKSKNHHYIEYGTISGGEAGILHTLLDIRRIQAPKDKIERLLLDLGDAQGQPLKNRVSYFQVSLEKNNPRVVIDLSQMNASGVDQKKISQIFKSSTFVKTAKINFDPIDTTITIQLELKKNVQLEAFQLTDKTKAGRIVIDLKEKI